MRTLLSCLSLTLILAGCGFKGPLYLPKAPAKPATAAPAKPQGKPEASAARRDASVAKGEASAAR